MKILSERKLNSLRILWARRKDFKMPKGKDHYKWNGGKAKCIDCGKELSYWEGNKRSHPTLQGRCLKCRSKYQSGKKHWNWQGGIGKEPYSFNFNDELKELIRRRDNYKCQKCSCPQEECLRKLAIHHIDYNKENSDPKNLISLCNSCNVKVNANREYWKQYFQNLKEER